MAKYLTCDKCGGHYDSWDGGCDCEERNINMDKLILNVYETSIKNDTRTVRIDKEADKMIRELALKTDASQQSIASAMIKFCYPRIEVKQMKFCFAKNKGE